MEVQTPHLSTTLEQTVIQIMRKLSPERVSELIDFARFLEFQATERYQDWVKTEAVRDDQAGAGDQRWEEILAQPEAKRLMRQMAREAREDYRAGRTTEMVETDDGRLAPG